MSPWGNIVGKAHSPACHCSSLAMLGVTVQAAREGQPSQRAGNVQVLYTTAHAAHSVRAVGHVGMPRGREARVPGHSHPWATFVGDQRLTSKGARNMPQIT